LKFEFRYSYFEFGDFSSEAKSSASTIGPTCAFDTKIYKNVGGIFNVSASVERDKKNLQISDFCFQLQAILVDFL